MLDLRGWTWSGREARPVLTALALLAKMVTQTTADTKPVTWGERMLPGGASWSGPTGPTVDSGGSEVMAPACHSNMKGTLAHATGHSSLSRLKDGYEGFHTSYEFLGKNNRTIYFHCHVKWERGMNHPVNQGI